MPFVFFLLLLWAAGYFHRWEHRAFLREMAFLRGHADMAFALPKGMDWRVVRREGDRIYLRRAFNVRGRADVLRYGAPVLIFLGFLFLMKSWLVALAYLAAMIVKWFAACVVIDIPARRYDVMLGGWTLFGEPTD